ncbi:MAG: Glu-tRNA(Gln) amidotransferase subunit GatD [Nitrosopumilus sp.]|nr:Glu-tRNA(Gln) amidotransferase subunit GatD [Nitrosopumilus sp.]MDA7943097.1 Glu-tRNA(Gln) amidotransferase subunit GatD [Nitrosopumilus sp.]
MAQESVPAEGDYRGYWGETLEFLKERGYKVDDSVVVTTDDEYEGFIMPRYEGLDDKHLVLKLKSGYNVGLRTEEITDIQPGAMPQGSREILPPVVKRAGLPNILLLSTGGTIASRIDNRTGAVIPEISPEDMARSVPEMFHLANIDVKNIFSVYSENIDPDHWLELARHIEKYSKYDGIIVAHGTDTMHYTSAFLSFALAGFKTPVVLVGAQKSFDRPSSDAPLNLIGAVQFITKNGKSGVWIAMHVNENDQIIAVHAGTRVRKNHTSKRGAFETIGSEPAFLVDGNDITDNFKENYFNTKEFTSRIAVEPNVGLVKPHPGLDPSILNHMINLGYKAIILEGTGLGHVPKSLYDVIKKAIEEGIFVGMTSQCIAGTVNMNIYGSGRDLIQLGVVPLKMIPETALVKAMWAASQKSDMKDIMLKNIASEIS